VTREGDGMIIVVDFNNICCGVLVDSVEVIHRLRWDEIAAPSHYLISLQAPVTGTAQVDKETVLIADFETIIGEILGLQIAVCSNGEFKTLAPKDVRLLLADDSAMLRKSLIQILNAHGYDRLTVCRDGQEAWDTLEQMAQSPEGPPDLVLSDIEMPRMDGMHLTLRIKEDARFQDIPVVLFSSLINAENARKCKSVGADAQVSKPDSDQLTKAIEKCLAQVGKQIAPETVSV
jgi:two-component system chemotaxis response regulator CheV